MTTIDYKHKIKDYMNSSEVDTLYKSMLNNLFPELAESEDEKIRKHLIGVVELYYGNTDEQEKKDCLAWLENKCEQKQELLTKEKALKNSPFVEPKQEWSEEDKKMLNDIIMCGEHGCYLDVGNIDWLKNLKERVHFQSQWKPSNKQLEVMGYLAKYYAVGIDEPNRSIIISLYEDLQKLMKE